MSTRRAGALLTPVALGFERRKAVLDLVVGVADVLVELAEALMGGQEPPVLVAELTELAVEPAVAPLGHRYHVGPGRPPRDPVRAAAELGEALELAERHDCVL